MNYNIIRDIESVLEIAEMTVDEFAGKIGVSRVTVVNWLNGEVTISEKHIKAFYDYVFDAGIKLNKIKEQLYREDTAETGEKLLFHGSKSGISGELNLDYNKKINDFGNGFYCGESLEQSAMFVASYPESSLYMLKFDVAGLKSKEFSVSREWMLTIAYYRGRLKGNENTKIVKKLIEESKSVDYIIAPIADNRMFEIIDSFIDGEITDEQCKHCLSATNLGMQYVFVSEKALSGVKLLEKCYLSEAEKLSYLSSRQESYNMNRDKVKLARKQYRNQGNYIEDILK